MLNRHTKTCYDLSLKFLVFYHFRGIYIIFVYVYFYVYVYFNLFFVIIKWSFSVHFIHVAESFLEFVYFCMESIVHKANKPSPQRSETRTHAHTVAAARALRMPACAEAERTAEGGGRQVSLGAQPTCPPPLPRRSSPTFSAPSPLLLQLQCSPLSSSATASPPLPPPRRPTARLSVSARSSSPPPPCRRRPRLRPTAAGSRTASPPSTAPTCCSTRTTL